MAEFPILGLHKKTNHVRNKVKPVLASISTN